MFSIITCKSVAYTIRCFIKNPSVSLRALSSHSITNSVPLELAYDHFTPKSKTTSTSSPIVLSHGLFAHRKIWESIGKTLSEKINRDVYTIDLRNHGDSPFSEHMFLPDITLDVEKFIAKMPNAPTLIGHSLGGLCSILLSITKPELVKDLVIIDISPTSFPEGMELHVIYFTKVMNEVLPKIPLNLNLDDAKSFVDSFFQSSIPIPFVRKLLLSSLSKTDDGFIWKINSHSISKIFGDPKIFSLFPFKGRYDGNVSLIYGEQSPYVKIEEAAEMKKIFPNLKFHCITDCTHWIYEEKPDELIEILTTLL